MTTTSTPATNITWHNSSVTAQARAKQKQQTPVVLWFTGLSGSGKSTIANAVEHQLLTAGAHSYLLDGDNMRHGLNQDLGFSAADREENIRRIGEVANLFVDAGVIVLTAFISPFRADREKVRARIGEAAFIEVFVDTPLAVCEARDPKGLYKKARAGDIPDFTGIDSAYEPPDAPEIHLHTDQDDIETCAQQVVSYLNTHGFIRAPQGAN
jgi:adenylylsulfate kinase (EC 2.7.1.25)